jgi:hypothetical protein
MLSANKLRVHIPPSRLDECACCRKVANKYCASCGEAVYCSAECQKTDWPEHKAHCGKTDRIDVSSFYPFIACLVDENHMTSSGSLLPYHPALTHQIINNPAPNSNVCVLPNGTSSNIVMLGDSIPLDNLMGSDAWWPAAASPSVRGKLATRIQREGNVLQILTAVCLALVAEIYTTTSGTNTGATKAQQSRRVRLRFHSSPIADFGLCIGSAAVTAQDKLAYVFLDPDADLNAPLNYVKGQDPDEHYWLYFTTAHGEDVTLDCSMFTFNMCTMIQTQSYCPHYGSDFSQLCDWSPAYLRDRDQDRHATYLHKERRRISALRDPDIRKIAERDPSCPEDIDSDALTRFMEKVSGRTLARESKEAMLDFTKRIIMHDLTRTRTLMAKRGYLKFPEQPIVAIQGDPEELVDIDNEIPDDYLQKARRLRSKERKGLLSHEEVKERLRKLNESMRSRTKVKR